jgi:hypothetical protein
MGTELDRPLLAALLSDPASLSQLVRHAGLAVALGGELRREALEVQAVCLSTARRLTEDLNSMVLKIQPAAVGVGEAYGSDVSFGEKGSSSADSQLHNPADIQTPWPFLASEADFEQAIDNITAAIPDDATR